MKARKIIIKEGGGDDERNWDGVASARNFSSANGNFRRKKKKNEDSKKEEASRKIGREPHLEGFWGAQSRWGKMKKKGGGGKISWWWKQKFPCVFVVFSLLLVGRFFGSPLQNGCRSSSSRITLHQPEFITFKNAREGVVAWREEFFLFLGRPIFFSYSFSSKKREKTPPLHNGCHSEVTAKGCSWNKERRDRVGGRGEEQLRLTSVMKSPTNSFCDQASNCSRFLIPHYPAVNTQS